MKNTLETRLGMFAAVIVLAAVTLVEILGGTERFQRTYVLHALFSGTQELKKGDAVKMAGVEIGRVKAIDLSETNNKVMVTLKLKEKYKIRTDAVAMVKYTGLMGQNFIGIDFGTPGSPYLSENNFVQTAEQPDISAVIQKINNVAGNVENLTKSFTGDKIDNLLGPFTDFLKANQMPLTVMIANMQAISSQISQGKGSMGKLIYDDTLYNAASASITNLQDITSEVKMTIGDARKSLGQVNTIFDNINAGQGTIGKLFKDDLLYRETTLSMTNMREIFEKINKGQGSVGKLINDEGLYKNAQLTLQKLDKATEGLEDQGPLTVMGIIVGNLF
jgi:phospholipid/cholesterol/gamma-HCH transport system substrate-binding protein